MKRKFLISFISVISALCMAFCAACDVGGGDGGHTHIYSADWLSDSEYHWHACTSSDCNGEGITKTAHVDENGDGKCDVCGHAVGAHEHALTLVSASEATCTKDGNRAYYSCSGCYMLFLDEGGQTETALADVVIEALGHQPAWNGVCSVCGKPVEGYGEVDLTELCASTHGYEYLGTMSNGSARRRLYEAIDEAAATLHKDVKKDYAAGDPFAILNYAALNLTTDDAVAVWKTFTDDHPLYYWFSNTVLHNNTQLALCVDDNYLQGSIRAACNELIYEKIDEYMAYAEGETSAYQIALAFHDKIITAIDYAEDSRGNPESAKWAHDIIGVFEERGAVCEGYAKAFQLLLNVKGVENIFVDGDGIVSPTNRGAHAWNLVKLDDGQWYWCDLTWDDMPEYEWGITYQYFCVNDTQGVGWADGGDQTSVTQTGEGIGGNAFGNTTFVSQHEPSSSSDTGVHFLYGLPARSPHVYAGVEGELRVRDTFEADGVQYAVTGYRTAQVTKVRTAGAVTIPERVTHEGKNYTVISIGVIGATKLFGMGSVFDSAVTAVTLPSSLIYIGGWSFNDCAFHEISFNGTKEAWNKIQKRSGWKRTGQVMTIRCIDENVVE